MPGPRAIWYSMNSNSTDLEQVVQSHTSNITPEWLAERVWCTKSQSLLLNIYFRLSGFQSSLLLIHFCYGPNTCLHYTQEWCRISSICDSPLQFRHRCSAVSLTEMAPKSPLLCVNRGPISYVFRACATATRYSLNRTRANIASFLA